jgi:hypothetical protein
MDLGSLQAHQLAAMTLEGFDQPGFRVDRHGVGDQAAARLQGRPCRVQHTGIG